VVATPHGPRAVHEPANEEVVRRCQQPSFDQNEPTRKVSRIGKATLAPGAREWWIPREGWGLLTGHQWGHDLAIRGTFTWPWTGGPVAQRVGPLPVDTPRTSSRPLTSVPLHDKRGQRQLSCSARKRCVPPPGRLPEARLQHLRRARQVVRGRPGLCSGSAVGAVGRRTPAGMSSPSWDVCGTPPW
jgi:hypothetical protein